MVALLKMKANRRGNLLHPHPHPQFPFSSSINVLSKPIPNGLLRIVFAEFIRRFCSFKGILICSERILK